MNLKEAFHYQNFITSIADNAQSLLRNPDDLFRTVEHHMISKADPEKADFDKTNDAELQYSKEILIDILDLVLNERYAIAVAITKAKRKFMDETGQDIDALAATNKSRHMINGTVKSLCNFKKTVREVPNGGIGYKFNVEGNQVLYRYDITIEKTPNVDREYALNWLRKSQDYAEWCSNELDKAYINTEVDFVPSFDQRMSFDDIVEHFVHH